MGVPLAEFLSKQKNDVTVTSRSQHDAVGNVKYVQINAKDDLALKKLLSECEYDVIVRDACPQCLLEERFCRFSLSFSPQSLYGFAVYDVSSCPVDTEDDCYQKKNGRCRLGHARNE